MIKEEHRINFDTIGFSDFDFRSKVSATTQVFEMGSLTGIAEMIGYQMFLFKRTETERNIVLSMDWGEADDPVLLDIVQVMLRELDCPLAPYNDLMIIESIYGKADLVDDGYENMSVYYSLNQEKCMLYAFGIDDARGLCKIELIHDLTILEERLSVLKD